MDFRIGVNLGDVIVEDGRIYGDGINIAARVEKLAEPGGICVSGKVHDEVCRKLDMHFEDLGEHELHNIAAKVRALTLNPNDDLIVVQKGEILTWIGQPEEGVPWIRKAIRFNPYHPPRFWNHLGRAYFRGAPIRRGDRTIQAPRGAGPVSPRLSRRLLRAVRRHHGRVQPPPGGSEPESWLQLAHDASARPPLQARQRSRAPSRQRGKSRAADATRCPPPPPLARSIRPAPPVDSVAPHRLVPRRHESRPGTRSAD